MNISFASPGTWWWLPVCLLAGMAAAWLVYGQNRDGFSVLLRRILAVIRGTAVALLAFLLLSPFIHTTQRHKEKPILVVALDQSASMAIGKDSAFYRKEFPGLLDGFMQSLHKQFDVRPFSFGQTVREGITGQFTDKVTNMADLLTDVRDRFSNRNLAAIVLVSDGIINEGTDPGNVADNMPCSFYAVATGDTLHQKDVLVNQVQCNQIAFSGNEFPMSINVSAHQAQGASSKLTVVSDGQLLLSTDFRPGSNDANATYNLNISATKPGIKKIRIELSALRGEISTANNVKEVFVEVMEGKQKVLLLYNSPHPDISALWQGLSANPNYEVSQMQASEFHGSLGSYSLVILHQLPSLDNSSSIMSGVELKNSPVPLFFILGQQSNLSAFSAYQVGVKVQSASGSPNASYPVLANDFSLFALPTEWAGVFSSYPPLSVPFGKYDLMPSANVLLYQKVGTVSTKLPLLVLNNGLDRKSAVLLGEGIWRWRLADFALSGKHETFDTWLSKIVQYLVLKEDKSRFRINTKKHFYENEPIRLDAELYNDSYELVNEPEVEMDLVGPGQKKYPFRFSRSDKAYFLNAGILPPGEYTYRAFTQLAGKKFEKQGSFSVQLLDKEYTNLTADHNLLNNLAVRHHGLMVLPKQLDALKQELLKRDDFRTVSYAESRFTELSSFWPMLVFVVLLLATEWFLRKRFGSY